MRQRKSMGEGSLNLPVLSGALATFLAVFIYGTIHSLLASHWLKAWSKDILGSWYDRFYRLVFNVLGTITFLPVLLIAWLTPSRLLYQIEPPWLWLTVVLQILSILALVIGLLQTGAAEFLGLSQLMGDNDSVGAGESQLFRAGFYQWVRHPLYTAGLLFIWLIPSMTSNLLALNLGISLYLYIGSIYEERKLISEWGDDYRQYQRNVPRLIPLPWKRARKD